MQWTSAVNGGFDSPTAKPWLPVPSNNSTVNVLAEKSDPKSLYSWYHSLIALKKSNTAFSEGEFTMLDRNNPNVLSWKRQAAGAPPVVVCVNFSADPQSVNLVGPGLPEGAITTLLKTPGASDPPSLKHINLGPYGVYIGQLQFMISH